MNVLNEMTGSNYYRLKLIGGYFLSIFVWVLITNWDNYHPTAAAIGGTLGLLLSPSFLLACYAAVRLFKDLPAVVKHVLGISIGLIANVLIRLILRGHV
ncbi:hypothetical protein [Legionella antarctica]|nr:hypothetical protein [Legionella antarctica]